MEYVDEFILLALLNWLGAAAPGPDFILVAQSSLNHGAKHGCMTALGIATGVLFHVSYCLLGIGFIIAQSVFIFNLIKYLGAAFLIYLGVKALIAKQGPSWLSSVEKSTDTARTAWEGYRRGVLVNVLNPKCALFFLSVFTQVIDPGMPIWVQWSLGLECVLIGLIWFCFLSLVLNLETTRSVLSKAQTWIEKIMGTALVALGLKIATIAQ